MSTDLYELIAYAARYWFALLAVLVAFYGWRACVTDNRRARILRYQAHGAGCVGERVMLDDGTKKKKNRKPECYQFGAEAVIGSGRTADVRIRARDVKKRHIFMTYRPGEMVLHAVDGAPFTSPVNREGEHILRDGDELQIGALRMTLVFFNAEDAAADESGARQPKVAQVLPEDVSDDEFEDVWE